MERSIIMKKSLSVLLVSLFSTCMYAFYPANVARENGDGPYLHAVMDIAHDDANIYVAKLDGHLVVINKASGEKTILDVKVGSLSYTPWAIAVHDGKVWIGTAESKILYYSNGQFHHSGIKIDWEYSNYSVLSIENITFDTQGNMFVSCSYGVGFKVDPNNNVERFTFSSKSVYSFSGHICVDRDSALWVASYGLFVYDYGLVKYTKDKETVYFFKEHPDVPQGAGNVTAMAVDEEGGIWYTAANKLTRLINDEMSVSYDCSYICYDMQFDSQQRLWMADHHGPLRMMENGAFTSYPCPFESKRWMCMDIDIDNIYIGTDTDLLIYKDGEYTKIDLSLSDETTDIPYHPLLEDGKVWKYQPEFGEYGFPYELRLNGDTVVDSRECKKLFRGDNLYAFLYEEQQKVYYRYAQNGGDWSLLYDFSLMPGDQVTDRYGTKYEVERVDNVNVNGEQLRRIIFKYTKGWQVVWVSGVGGRRDLFDPFVNTPGDYCHLVTCEVNGKLLYEGDDFMTGVVSADPESGIFKIDGLKYRLDDENNEAVIEKENRWEGELTIPSEVSYGGLTYQVTSMKRHAFSGCTTLTRISLPSTISTISGNPFIACNSLRAIEVEAGNKALKSEGGVLFSADGTLLYSYPAGATTGSYTAPDGLKTVGTEAFSRSPYLSFVKLPGSVTDIQDEGFLSCTALEKVELPNGLTRISDNMLRECSSLKEIVIPESVTSLGDYALMDCTSLKEIVIPEGVTSLGLYALMGCTSLTTASLPSTIPVVNYGIFKDCSSLTKVNIAKGIVAMNGNMFANCSSLRKLVLPESIRNLGESSFSGCSIDTLTIKGQFFSGSLNKGIFNGMGTSTILCVHWADVDKFKEFYQGTVIPWNKGVPDDSYYPMLKTGKIWNIQESRQEGSDTFYRNYSLHITGDTIINGRSYYVMCAEGDESPLCPDKSYWMESDRKVRCNDLSVIYLFSMKVGSGFINGGQEDICTAENCVDMAGRTLRQFEITCHDGSIVSWLEGIGNEDCGPLFPFGRNADDGITVKLMSVYEDGVCIFSRDGSNEQTQMAYRPMIEDGKVWKVGSGISNNLVQMVEYYYFDGDTIVDGKTCKKMMYQRYVSPDHSDYAIITQYPLFGNAGVWYEEDKKVYFSGTMMYDFSLAANDTLLFDNYYVIGPRQTGGIEGFKGVHRDVFWCTDGDPYYCITWLEGVGSIEGPHYNIYNGEEYHPFFLMSCTVGDEVIYLNDEYEDGATPEAAGARNRFDFTHTIKTKPKAPRRSEDERSVYGEYDKLQLGINLNLLADDYMVRITDDSGNVIYEKAVNASTIVGLNIDISGYAKGHYTVTVENSQESFTGEFNTLPTGIEETTKTSEVTSPHIYNLQGQRISTLQKGLNIVNGRKVAIK